MHGIIQYRRRGSLVSYTTATSGPRTPRNQTRETAFLVQKVLRLRFRVSDFGVYMKPSALNAAVMLCCAASSKYSFAFV